MSDPMPRVASMDKTIQHAAVYDALRHFQNIARE